MWKGISILDWTACNLTRFGILYVILYLAVMFFANLKKLKSSPKADLKGKHVMITGGSSGIGKQVAIEVAKRGADISILARNPQKLSEAAEEIKSQVDTTFRRFKIVEISVDISKSYDEVHRAVQEATAKLGPVYMLVNCAGYSVCRKFENLTENDEKSMMNLNYFGSLWTTKAVLPSMKADPKAGGYIVFVASQAGLLGLYGMTGYCGSKFAIRGFAESLAMGMKYYLYSPFLVEFNPWFCCRGCTFQR